MNTEKTAAKTINQIRDLPSEFTPWGTVRSKVLDTLFELSPENLYDYSVETGTGRTTLLLSHLSKKHIVFSLTTFEQLGNVQESNLLDRSVVTFVEGPTQRTVPQFQFEQKIDFALLDGPHAYPFPEIEYF